MGATTFRTILVTVGIAATLAAGCEKGNPCAALAARVCRDRGAGHPECVGRRESARTAGPEEMLQCERDLRPGRYDPMLRAKQALERALEEPEPDGGEADAESGTAGD